MNESPVSTLERKKNRRGLLALVGAGGAAAVAALFSRSNGAEAAHNPIHHESSTSTPAVHGNNTHTGPGVQGDGSIAGVYGYSDTGRGVYGWSNDGYGVKGSCSTGKAPAGAGSDRAMARLPCAQPEGSGNTNIAGGTVHGGRSKACPVLGGLHHEYEWKAA